MEVFHMLYSSKTRGIPVGRKQVIRSYVNFLKADGADHFKQKMESCRDILMCVLFKNQNDEDVSFHFKEILYDRLELLMCRYDNPLKHELSDLLLDLTMEVEEALRDMDVQPGDIYIPCSYFYFVGVFRSIFWLMGIWWRFGQPSPRSTDRMNWGVNILKSYCPMYTIIVIAA